jgi:hypothetical protein
MNILRTYFGKCASGILFLSAVATAQAQSTWNYFISDAGGGNSLLTWNVSGSLATPPGATLTTFHTSIAISINAPGIFADAFVPTGSPQSISTPDGSYFQLDGLTVYSAVDLFNALNAPGSSNDSFALLAHLFAHQGDPGHQFLYSPGSQSALIPIDFADFNPGVYQSQQSGFNTPLTVNLTVGPVPEPSALALFALGGLSGLTLLRRKGRSYEKAQPPDFYRR